MGVLAERSDFTGFLFGAVFVLAVVCALLGQALYKAKREFQSDLAEALEEWKRRELDRQREEIRRAETVRAAAELSNWKATSEANIRADAIRRSGAVLTGKVTEHLAPYMPSFPYNPRDARFLGAPIDLLVFDGLSDDAIIQIVFLEVKTASSALTKRQKQIRDAIESGRVIWRELRT